VITFFALLPAVFASGSAIAPLASMFLIGYGGVALHRMYGQSWTKTLFKSMGLGCSYAFTLGVGSMLVFMAGFFF
jgi:hypothetical protein